MINQLLIYLVSISILTIILIFINRVIYYTEHSNKPKPKQKPRPTLTIIKNNVHPEKKFYWGNHEFVN